MDVKSNIIKFEEAQKRREEQRENEEGVEQLTFQYHLTSEDTCTFLKVLNFIRTLSLDGSLTVHVEDDSFSITKTSSMILHDFDVENENEEAVSEFTMTNESTVSFPVDWESISFSEDKTAETAAGEALCDSIMLFAEFDCVEDDVLADHDAEDTDE